MIFKQDIKGKNNFTMQKNKNGLDFFHAGVLAFRVSILPKQGVSVFCNL